jgi:hypothetical protein
LEFFEHPPKMQGMPRFKSLSVRSRDQLAQIISSKSTRQPAQRIAWRWSGFHHRVLSFSFMTCLIARPKVPTRPATLNIYTNRLKFLALLLLSVGLLNACASREEKEGVRWSTDPEVSGQAHPAAYGITDTFYVGKPQAIRPANDAVFYYKKCSMQNASGERAFFTKTEYNCNDPR